MEIRETLNITAEEFFMFLKAILVNEVYKQTGRKIGPYQVRKGFSYKYTKKSRNGDQPITYTVTELKNNHFFAATITEPKVKVFIEYEVTPNKNGIVIRYKQYQQQIGSRTDDKISFFQQKQIERSMKKQLNAMEKQIYELRRQKADRKEAQNNPES